MGSVYARIRLSNELRPDLAPVEVDVLIDPRNERLILPPDRPNFAFAKIK